MTRTSRLWPLAGLLAGTVVAGACASASSPSPRAFPNAPEPPPRPVRSAEHGMPNGPVAEAVLETALSLRGIRYQFGGSDPASGFDCSGLVHYVFGLYQIDLPRTTGDLYATGVPVDIDAVEAGDLIFFSTIGPGATHVGIALGTTRNPAFVHAPSSNGVVRVERFDSAYWEPRIVGVRRVF